jgi:chromosome segregation ATPase
MRLQIHAVLYVLLCSSFAVNATIKCWTDEDGILNCGNVVPPRYSQEGFQEFNQKGIVVQEVERAKTQEEIQEEQRIESERMQKYQACLLERERDDEILDLFNSEQGIENERTNRLNTIDATIDVIKSQISRSEKNLADMEHNLQESLDNPSVSDVERQRLRMNIDSVKKNIQNFEKNLVEKYAEKQETDIRFDTFLQRFSKIQREGRTDCRQYAPAQPPTEQPQR